jgi:hypothetical protein
MTPKEKANELYLKYTDTLNIRDLQVTANPFAKQCALIAVHEILQMIDESMKGFLDSDIIRYWLEVKTEIEKL